jgi:hypothetical protein
MQVPRTSPAIAVIVILLGCALSLAAQPAIAVLYDIDFGTPPHTVGQPPATGGGPPPRNTVSSIPFGIPTVVASFGALTDQPLEFDSFDNQGDQIRMRLDDLSPSDLYGLETEILIADIASSGGEFVVLFDMPSVRTVRFLFGGNIIATVPGFPNTTIGTWTPGRVINLTVNVDILNDSWEIYLDNALAHAGPFGGATDRRAVRISTNVTPNPPHVSVGIDNLIIAETLLPVPVEAGSWGKIKSLYR